MLRALIDPTWAENVTHFQISRFNRASAEDLLSEVDIPKLGGLMVDLSNQLMVDRELKANARMVKHIIDLTFDHPGVETHTGHLVTASREQLGEEHPLTLQLIERSRPNGEHGPNEPWFLPFHGVTIVEYVPVSAPE